ncbi:MAG: shikimate kinase [Kineosporiaceae bacterium]
MTATPADGTPAGGAAAADGRAAEPARPLVVVVGPMGSGKSTVGSILARRLGVALRDTDADVEVRAGKSVSDIFVDDGEPVFRDLERQAVVVALDEHPGVLALGGGAVMDPLTEEALRGHTVVFLDVQVTDAARRIGLNRDRPLLLGNPRAQWLRIMERRRPVYQRVSTAVVPTDGRTPEEVAEAVLAELALGERA